MALRPDVVSFAAGVLFAAGLAVAGMTQPAKVVNFLDVTGSWDPSLAFVMGGALIVYGVALKGITRRDAPIFGGRFLIPTRSDLTPRLFVGAALFGIGWGLSGFCPGPAITALGSGMKNALIFLPAMAAGMALFHGWDAWRARTSDSPETTASRTGP